MSAVLKTSTRGATAAEWTHFDFGLALTSSLLPVACDPARSIKPGCTIVKAKIGKVPAVLTRRLEIESMKDWRTHQTTSDEVSGWAATGEYNIGLRTDHVRAIDTDIENGNTVDAVLDSIKSVLEFKLPVRGRDNSNRVAVLFTLGGDWEKRIIKVNETERIEFLANGQQIIVAGTHPSGSRYEFDAGLPADIPTLTPAQFTSLWEALQAKFDGKASKAPASSRRRLQRGGDARQAVLDAATGADLDQLDEASNHIDVETYDAWIAYGQALASLKSTTHENRAKEMWLKHSARSAQFKADEAESKWSSFKPDHSTWKSVFVMAGANGWVNPGPPPGNVNFDSLEPQAEAPTGERMVSDFYAFLPSHQYIDRQTRALWPATSVDGHVKDRPDGKTKPSAYLDMHRAVHGMTWAPGHDEIIRDIAIDESGWRPAPGVRVYNRYRAPELPAGDPDLAGPWLDHVRRLYPDDVDHIVAFFAHRVQRPGEKINHCLLLGGSPGCGKDTALEPLKRAVGSWNWSEVSPTQLLGRFNGYLQAVVMRVSEARDLGDVDRYALHEHLKVLTAAPPDSLRVDEKHLREFSVPNCVAVVITSNHRVDCLYLPADDRRTYVAWSRVVKEEFTEGYWNQLWGWIESGGAGHVAAYLRAFDLGGFDPKAPPPRTPAWHDIVAAGCDSEEVELVGALDELQQPPVVTLWQLRNALVQVHGMESDLVAEFADRKARRRLPHRMERAGYEPVRNPDAKDGLWRIDADRQVVYARRDLGLNARLDAARGLSQ